MRTTQPNFENLKRNFFNAFFQNHCSAGGKVEFAIFRAGVREVVETGKMPQPFYKRKQEFEKDFNKWLDGIDIRCAGELIDILVEQKKEVVAWMKRKDYVIDYNDHGALDLIKKQ